MICGRNNVRSGFNLILLVFHSNSSSYILTLSKKREGGIN